MKALRHPFGKGASVSLFTLGTMRAISSSEVMYSVVKEALSSGINHLETAPSYGLAETLLGISIKKLKEEGLQPQGGWVITSKLLPGVEFVEGQKQIKKTLKRLGLKKLDNLAIHGINLPEHLQWVLKGEGARILRWAEDENLIGQVGFSSHGSIPLIEETLGSMRFQFCSLHLHLFDQARIPIAKKALNNGLGVMAISPADKGGRLYAPSSTLLKDCYPFSPLELAYRFLLAEGITTLTIGASHISDFNYAKKLSRSNHPLDPTEKKAVNHLSKEGKRRLGKTHCGQCQECLPCPKDVPIPELLRLRNLAIGHDMNTFAKERYNLIGRAGHWWEEVKADSCEKCRDCVPRCPNKIPIPDLLEETHKLLAEAPRRKLWG